MQVSVYEEPRFAACFLWAEWVHGKPAASCGISVNYTIGTLAMFFDKK